MLGGLACSSFVTGFGLALLRLDDSFLSALGVGIFILGLIMVAVALMATVSSVIDWLDSKREAD
jgi:hypothetical protein